MNWTRSLVAAAAVASCALVGAHAIAAPAPNAPATQSAIQDGSSDYTVKSAAAGAGVKVTITVISQYHINKAYPVKWNKAPVDGANIAYSGGTADLPSTVTVTIPKEKAGSLKFGYCSSDGSTCKFGELPISI